MAGTAGADIGDTGPITYLGGHLAHQGFNGVVGGPGAPGHHAWPFQGPFGSAGYTHADVAEAFTFQLRHPTFRIGIEGVAPVDQQVPFFQVGGDRVNGVVNGLAGLDHHQDPPRALQCPHKILQGRCADDVLAGTSTSQELFRFGVGAVVDDRGVTVALGIEHQVFTHYPEADQAEMRLAHG